MQTAVDSDSTVTRVMTIGDDATSSVDGQYYCKTIVDGAFGVASSDFNLTISSKKQLGLNFTSFTRVNHYFLPLYSTQTLTPELLSLNLNYICYCSCYLPTY